MNRLLVCKLVWPCWSARSVLSSHYTPSLTVLMAGVSLCMCVYSQTTGSRCACSCGATSAVSEDRDVSGQLLPNVKPVYLASGISGPGYVHAYPRASYVDKLATGPEESWKTARETVGSGG